MLVRVLSISIGSTLLRGTCNPISSCLSIIRLKSMASNLAGVKGLLIDISGVLKDGDVVIDGSVAAIEKLQSAKFPFRVVTNETLKPRKTILSTLSMLGYNIEEKILFSPVPAAVEILKRENLRPHLLVHPRMVPEFEGVDFNNPNCVVMADAYEHFTFENMNECFRKLMAMENPVFFSLGIGKYYMDDDGMALDVGGFAKCLEYATGVSPRIVGKPSREYFHTAVNDMNLNCDQVMMIGDDVEHDVGGAQAAGLKGALVRTGKFTKKDENHPKVKPDLIVNNLAHAVDLLFGTSSS
uniref:Phospholysine phosphohistidine inorganic pyrophosphate phosphatase n=1 Tax=Lygus hesperus TaxID=30085 RepID=A0A0A9YF17_LYGHE